MDWLLAPIDPDRAHAVGVAVSWHGRIMVLAWGVLAPLAVVLARFFKILPGQDWPRELDTTLWWRSHWMGQVAVVCLSLLGVALVAGGTGAGGHGRFGYVVLALVVAQAGFGLMRGSKGGPTAPAPDGSPRGDHYDMTPWRRMFEAVHKTLGYTLIVVAAYTIGLGLWLANAPRWMWLVIALWWVALMIAAMVLQRRGWAVDTYQAIWGPGPEHPGNRRKAPGWGMRRLTGEESHVRRD